MYTRKLSFFRFFSTRLVTRMSPTRQDPLTLSHIPVNPTSQSFFNQLARIGFDSQHVN